MQIGQTFSRNVADKETNKETNKEVERKQNPVPYRGRGKKVILFNSTFTVSRCDDGYWVISPFLMFAIFIASYADAL